MALTEAQYTPDCGDSVTVPLAAQEWLHFFCKLAEGAQEVLDDRASRDDSEAWSGGFAENH